LVEKVEGPESGEAKIGSTVTYRVTKYNRENVSDERKASVRWKIRVTDTEQDDLPEKGETISIEIQQTWAGKEIIIMPYLKQPTETVSVKTYCYILEHDILRADGKLNQLAATGARIDPGTGSEGPAQTLCKAFVELNIMDRNDNKSPKDLLRDDKLVNAIKLFEYAYMKKGIDECKEHIEKETIMAVDEALRAGWKFDRQEKSEEYRTDGVYVGIRNYDYFDGIWVKDGYLKNVDSSVMTKKDFEYIAGTVRAEASTHGAPLGSRTSIDTEALCEEAVAIYSVLRNRVTYSFEQRKKITMVIDRIDDSDGAEGRDRISEMTDIYTAESGSRTALVVRGLIKAIRDGIDYSKGAYYWDGADIRRNEHYTKYGVTFSKQEHNIYNIRDNPVPQTGDRGPYNYTFISRNAIGGTIFWVYTDEFKKMERHVTEYP
ncbi:MAG: hypothetical protein LBL58_19060, partial [Tannerellaceae bacterium]|nr:hypothetical protein [Tannerellaceae bacterium]